MTILTIASSKGGPGKTTMAELIVGTLASQGINVIALDADPTGGLSRWAAHLTKGRLLLATTRLTRPVLLT
jgi:chromosome partitioning protein